MRLVHWIFRSGEPIFRPPVLLEKLLNRGLRFCVNENGYPLFEIAVFDCSEPSADVVNFCHHRKIVCHHFLDLT